MEVSGSKDIFSRSADHGYEAELTSTRSGVCTNGPMQREKGIQRGAQAVELHGEMVVDGVRGRGSPSGRSLQGTIRLVQRTGVVR